MHRARFLVVLSMTAWAGCGQPPVVREVANYPLNDMDRVIARSGVTIDPSISADGRGSLQIVAGEPAVVRLFEVDVPDGDYARLSYQAKIRTDAVDGQVYLEMWCHFPGKGEFFSRALHAPLSGSNEWTMQSTDFMLQKGEKPDLVRLNLVVDGKGTAWVDDVRLLGTPM